jgi:hypothetical protein
MQNFSMTKNMAWENTELWARDFEQDYVNCIQKIVLSKPFGDHKFYIFSFVKRVDDASGIKKMFHQPRLTKPEPVPGTTLLRVDPSNPSDAIIIWTLPNEENFKLFEYGKMYGEQFVHECIEKYLKNPRELMCREEGDLSEDQIREIYVGMKRKKPLK